MASVKRLLERLLDRAVDVEHVTFERAPIIVRVTPEGFERLWPVIEACGPVLLRHKQRTNTRLIALLPSGAVVWARLRAHEHPGDGYAGEHDNERSGA